MLRLDSAINSLHNKPSPGRYSTTLLIDLMRCSATKDVIKNTQNITNTSSKVINRKIDFPACFYVQHITTTTNFYYQLLHPNE